MSPKPFSPHVAGIVPVSNYEGEFGLLLPNACLPLTKNYYMIQHAVVRCALAGCDTIWIVCEDDQAPLIREICGDFVIDPISEEKSNFAKFKSQGLKEIPIYYCPVHPKHRNRRDSYGWSVLQGALTAFHVSSMISKWVIPKNYYISFPFSYIDDATPRKFRSEMRSRGNILCSYEGQTVRHGALLDFCMDDVACKQYIYDLKRSSTGGSGSVEKRWSARYFSLANIFKNGNIDIEMTIPALEYLSVSDWESYTKLLNHTPDITKHLKLWRKK